MNPVRIRYQTIEFERHDIHIRSLLDKQQFSDPFGVAEDLGISSAQWSLFGVLWQAGEMLAREMQVFEVEGKRILEVGCGIALPSLLLNARQADITATDYHPEAGHYLAENVKLNHGRGIPFLRTDWKGANDNLGLFDVVIGADLLYERNHIVELSEFINKHAKPHCEVIVVDPGRGNKGAFSKKMMALGFSFSEQKKTIGEDKLEYSATVLSFLR
ncbi:histidine kinase [Dasania sp. GY-MA-18]|uniref:Histidine kinase n=1 Tax=Dasania phycosphaerae TaxID=2950436 RepID=A0A9J6RLZ4_9GAMM|nr:MULTISPECIES: histidine kinase [Dasania]MCR8922786.1 histidine kinase [Dasania sp. GY-MA-18]MCZ0865216.1 histidine kinase [Dasania phycosphaerae]MCZ0868942.1 histidine kinase [Dasania phycosphaerae]